jgi:signal transduction histidine kinase
MRLGIRTNEAVVVTLLTLVVVAATTLIHLAQLSRVVVEEGARQAELVARQVYAQSSRALADGGGGSPADVLRGDRDLRNLVDASIMYSPHLTDVIIADREGRALVHTEGGKEGGAPPGRRDLRELIALDPVRRAWALYSGRDRYETVMPIRLNGAPFGSIRIGVSTRLLARELNGALRQGLLLAGLALPLAWLVAIVLATLFARPLRALVAELDRLRRGEVDIAAHLTGKGEFGELASQLRLLGHELESDRLRISTERAQLQRLSDQLEDGLVFLNPERRVLFLNKVAETILGTSLDDVVGRPIDSVLPSAHPLQGLLEEAFVVRRDLRNVQTRLPLQRGPEAFLISVLLMTDVDAVMGAIVVLRDLESIRALHSIVSYSAKLADLGALTSGVAHEVKNPLNAMMIHLEVLREKLDAGPAETRASVEVIGAEIQRLDRVVQGFLKFVRHEELTLKPVDANSLLTGVATLLEAEWRPRGVGFAFDLEPGLPSISADEDMLRQVFVNLVQNAGQATPGEGTITFRTARQGDWVTATIADEGVGIPAEELDKIFKLYYSTKPDGNGIGLALVYRIVQMHDGVVDVASEVGRGTTVTVKLPAR